MLIPVVSIRSNRLEALPPLHLADSYIPVPERVSVACSSNADSRTEVTQYDTPASNKVVLGELRLHYISPKELDSFGLLENSTISTGWNTNQR